MIINNFYSSSRNHLFFRTPMECSGWKPRNNNNSRGLVVEGTALKMKEATTPSSPLILLRRTTHARVFIDLEWGWVEDCVRTSPLYSYG